jgi:hypothetical protein
MNIGWERKIGYSFMGLLAGNVVSLVVLLLVALLPHLDSFVGIKKLWTLTVGDGLGLAFAIWLFSMAAWVVVGLPVVLLLRAEIAADLYLLTSAVAGAVLGAVAMLLMFMALDHDRLDIAIFQKPETLGLFLLAALIAGVAFAVYCSLVKGTLRKQVKDRGAPSGTPRSQAWFDF